MAELLIVVAITAFLMIAVFTIYQVTQMTTFRASSTEASLVQARAVVDKFGGDFRMVGASRLLYTAPVTAATQTSITFEGDIDNTLDGGNNPVTVTTQINKDATSVAVSNAKNIACNTTITFADGPVQGSHHLAASGCGAPVDGPTTLTLDTTTVGCGTCIATQTFYPVGSYVYTVESVNWVWDSGTQKLCRKVNATCGASAWNEDSDVIASDVTNFALTYLDVTGNTLALSGGSLAESSRVLVRAVKVSVTVGTKAGDQTVTRTMELVARARAMVP